MKTFQLCTAGVNTIQGGARASTHKNTRERTGTETIPAKFFKVARSSAADTRSIRQEISSPDTVLCLQLYCVAVNFIFCSKITCNQIYTQAISLAHKSNDKEN